MLSFPVDYIADSEERSPQARAISADGVRAFHEHVERTHQGGYFPVGANSWWHGGVHLRSAGPVYAPLGGRLVCARLAGEGNEAATGHYGSRNFMLLEHTLGQHPSGREAEDDEDGSDENGSGEDDGPRLFTLFMHLRPARMATSRLVALRGFRWLRRAAEQAGTTMEAYLERLGEGKVAEIGLAVEAGEPLWEVGRYGSEESRARLVHWEMFSEAPLFGANGTATALNGEAESEPESSDEASSENTDTAFHRVEAAAGVPFFQRWFVPGMGEQTEEIGRLPAGTVVRRVPFPARSGGDRDNPGWWAVRTVDAGEILQVRAEAGGASAEGLAPHPPGWVRRSAYVTSARGPAEAAPGDHLTYEAGLNAEVPTGAERAAVRWEIRLGGERRPDLEKSLEATGTPLRLPITEEMAGQTLALYPYHRTVEPHIVARTRIATLRRPRWQEVRDPDENFNMDARKVQALFEAFDENEDGVLQAGEIKRFYDEEERARELRFMMCQHVSEWGVPDLEKAVSDLWGHYFWQKWGLGARIEPYQWWEDARAAGAALPADARVWHYNPISVLHQLWLDGYGQDEPTFFVRRGGREVEVKNPDELEVEEVVYVREDDSSGTTWKLGRIYYYAVTGTKGLYRKGDESPDLYEMLIEPATTPGMPEVSDLDARVWASLTGVEGNLDAVNSYDDAFLSFGPLQQTMGSGTRKGELQGSLNHIKKQDGALFREHFGRHGLDVTEITKVQAIDKGHAVIDGAPLTTKESKNSLSDFIWSYLSIKAMEDLRFRELFLRYGLSRIDWVRDIEATTEIVVGKSSAEAVTLRLGDVYKTDLGLAILLDTHINRPAYLMPDGSHKSNNIWIDDVKALLEEKETADPAEITEQDEYTLIMKLVQQRNSSGMTDARLRLGKILYYANPDNLGEMGGELGYESIETFVGGGMGLSAHGDWSFMFNKIKSRQGHKTLNIERP